MPPALHVLVSGRVQGVGFRHGIYLQAQKRGLTGWVKNRADGRVEARFEGDEPALQDMLEWCRNGPALARVDAVDAEWGHTDAAGVSFEITFG